MSDLSINEASKLLGLSSRTIRRMVKSGKLLAKLVKGKKWLEYRFDEAYLKNYLAKNGNSLDTFQNSVNSVNSNFLNPDQIVLPKDFIFRYEQLLVRIGQLESIREEYKMLTERAESLLKKEAEYKKLIEEKEKIIQDLQKMIENFTRKKWWQFWLPKRPLNFQRNFS